MTCYAPEQDALLLQQYMKEEETKNNNTYDITSTAALMRDTSVPTCAASPNAFVPTNFNNCDSNNTNTDMTDQPMPDTNKEETPNVVDIEVIKSDDATVVTDGIVNTGAIKQEVLDEQGCLVQEKKLMSLELLLNGADAEEEEEKELALNSGTMSPASDDGSRSSLSESERAAMSMDCSTPPPTAFPVQARPPCAICHSENGRCHASDPLSMQSFFCTSLGFDGVLSVADWLCMKCYSKWYNRCKRKASALNALAMVDGAQTVPSATTPPNGSAPPTPVRRKRTKGEPKDKEKRKHRKTSTKDREIIVAPVIEVTQEGEPELLDHDTDSDDALLLTRMTLKSYNNHYSVHNLSNSFNGTSHIDNRPHNITTGRDLEMEVDELHAELHRMRGEMMRLAQELSRRDEQMEGMLKFVKTEMSSMHGLLQDIADARWTKPRVSTPPQFHPYTVQTSPVVPQTNHIFHLNGKILDNNKPSPPPTPITPPSIHSDSPIHTHVHQQSDITA